MRTVGIVEAKSRLSELVAEVEAGETVLLTRNGRPVAEIVPAALDRDKARAAMAWILSHKPKKPFSDDEIRSLIAEGRRY